MITNAFLNIVAQLCGYIVSLLPPFSVHLPDSVKSMCGWLLGFDAFLPVSETLAVISVYGSIVGGFTVVKWTVKVVDYIFDVIP